MFVLRGQTDVFTIGDRDVGYPVKIKVKMENGKGVFNKW